MNFGGNQINYSQTRKATVESSDPLIRHVNLTISNPDGLTNKYAETDINYDTIILNNAGEHMCAVVNFAVPMQNMPLFIFPVQPNQGSGTDSANINTSTLEVGVCYNMDAANIDAGLVMNAAQLPRWTTPLTWIPQEMGLTKVPQNQSRQVITPYYYCYSFEHFVNLVNIAVQTSWNAAGNPGGTANVWTYCPKFAYDDSLKTFNWRLPSQFTGNALSTEGWSVCWNEDFDNLVNNFNTIENGNIFILEDVESALTNTNVAGNVILYQDYPTTDYFNSAERILVTTTSIPIAQDYFPGPEGQYQGLSNRERILVDVNLDFDNNITAQRSILKYQPATDIHQFNDMISTLPLQRISVKFRWVDSLNNVYDIPVSKGETVTCKLGFYNKSLLLNK